MNAAARHDATSLELGILIDRWQPRRGGAEWALAELAQWMEARGHRVRAYAIDAELEGERDSTAIHRVSVPWWSRLHRGARDRAIGEALVAAAENDGCDLTVGVRHLPRVDMYWPHGGSHVVSLQALVSAREERAVALGDVTVRGRHRTFIEMEAALLDGGGAGRVACVSTLVRSELEALYPRSRERLRTIPNGVDAERFHPRERSSAGARLRSELGVADGTPLLTFVGRNPLLKGLPVVFEALASLTREPWMLVVAGPQDVSRWQRRAIAAGIDRTRVVFLRDADPVALASASDLCVHPTWRDTCGMVVLEALSSGTPVITTRLAGAAEVVTSMDHGAVLDDPSRPEALRDVIAGWLDRIRSGAVDRDAVRAAVAGRDRATWLAALERELVDLARR